MHVIVVQDTCMSYEEEDTCMSYRDLLLFKIASRAFPTAASAARRAESISSSRKNEEEDTCPSYKEEDTCMSYDKEGRSQHNLPENL